MEQFARFDKPISRAEKVNRVDRWLAQSQMFLERLLLGTSDPEAISRHFSQRFKGEEAISRALACKDHTKKCQRCNTIDLIAMDNAEQVFFNRVDSSINAGFTDLALLSIDRCRTISQALRSIFTKAQT